MKIANVLISDSWGEVGPNALNRGIGGREGALLYLSREWAKAGNEVTNFVNVVKGKRFDEELIDKDVKRIGYHEYVPLNLTKPVLANFPYDVVIAWECPSLFEEELIKNNIKLKICEMQVAHLSEKETQAAMKHLDKMAVLSDWHGQLLMNAGLDSIKDKFVTLPNGVDIARYPRQQFESKITKKVGNNPKFVYSSSPDRGLWQILEVWPYLRKEFPEAELFICYGAKQWIEQTKWSHGRVAQMAVEIERLLEQPGVKDLGKIGQDVLATLQMDADAWVYPLDSIQSTETGCCPAGTLIDCPRDYKIYPNGIPIENIKIGQLVWTINEETKIFELKRVLKSGMTKQIDKVFKVTLDTGDVIRATAEHPFMLRDGTWKRLDELTFGDSLMPFNKDFEPLVQIRESGAFLPEYQYVSAFLGKVKGDGLVAHHRDENHINSSEENIEILTQGEHTKRHNISWERVNKVLTKEQKRQKQRHRANTRWNRVEDSKREWHIIHTKHRCKRPCFVCYDLYGYLPKQPEIKPGPGGKTARYQWKRMCEKEGILNHSVVSVAEDGNEAVYNLEVEDNHNYVVAGVVLHNCISAIENAAAGNPIITTDCDCMEDEFAHVGEIINLPFDPEQFAERTIEILKDQDLVEYLRETARSFAEKRDWREISQLWLQMFQNDLS